MTKAEYVWVAEKGSYSDRGIAGVWRDAEKAKEALHLDDEDWTFSEYDEGGFHFEEWHNGLSWDDAVRIVKTEIQ